MRLVALSVVIAMGATAAPLAAQTPPEPETYIHAGRLLDRPGSAPRGASTLIVRGGKVAEVRSGFVPPPPRVRLIDLSSKFVLPGLIYSHVHLESDAGLVEWAVAGDLLTDANVLKTVGFVMKGGVVYKE